MYEWLFFNYLLWVSKQHDANFFPSLSLTWVLGFAPWPKLANRTFNNNWVDLGEYGYVNGKSWMNTDLFETKRDFVAANASLKP